jgi:GNAT superfamily N-acetyltransferase
MSQDSPSPLRYVRYESARENEYVAAMRQLISKDLSEPYSIYVYRYFLYQWGDLCFLAMDDKDEMVGVVVSKLEPHRSGPLRGYIAMLAVREEYRGRGIATKLVRMAIDAMIERNADEVSLDLIGVYCNFFAYLASRVTDRPRDRNDKHCSDEIVRTAWFPSQQATSSILFEWKLCLSACSISKRRRWLDSTGL